MSSHSNNAIRMLLLELRCKLSKSSAEDMIWCGSCGNVVNVIVCATQICVQFTAIDDWCVKIYDFNLEPI
eukprot:CAMPEP_0169078548 /NCGR_PEP_ID=MMETSP1015-20121227/9468_1 /TAXON_ID=342587 /ORGANISM="Karlodinium micrum, Strain CCMP2283" /LENGTH=69 /DNA_ID=CAMNT_0009138141 /DNA_START=1210 /DNA_END=1419 /DNA_ORIENTATION=-